MPDGSRWDRALDELYAASPREFVLVRARLERELRDGGDADEAAEIRRRRPPQLAAWACNLLAGQEPVDVEELLLLTRQIADAQGTLGGRGDHADELRRLTRERNELLEQLADDAVRLLRGHTPKPDAHRSTIANTLDAASMSPALAPELQAGHLTQTLVAPSGFGPLPGSAPRSSSDPATQRRPSRRQLDKARGDLATARQRADHARAVAETAEAELTSAELASESAAAQVHDVREALTRAEDAARVAARSADEARQRSDAARAEARRAQAAFEAASESLESLEAG